MSVSKEGIENFEPTSAASLHSKENLIISALTQIKDVDIYLTSATLNILIRVPFKEWE